jgi:hypothetical protein
MGSVNALASRNETASIDMLARQLIQRFDGNKDGKLTTEEFTSVLRSLIEAQPSAAGTGGSSVPASIESSGIRRTDHMAGFDLVKLDHSQSTKYRFARAASEASLASVTDKASAEALLNSMRPSFERQGLDVVAIKGDRIQVMHEGQPIWVDVIGGANSGSPVFQWLPNA